MNWPSWSDPQTADYGERGGWWPMGVGGWFWPRPRLGFTVHVQCRDGVASHNTVPPQWGWNRFGSFHFGPRWAWGVPVAHVVPGLRNGVEWRCRCPPGRCEGKRPAGRRFVPW